MRKSISLALFGKDTRYAEYLSSAVAAYRALVPDFEIVLHHDNLADESTYGAEMRALEGVGLIRCVNMGEAPRTAAMLWRIAPIWEAGAGYVFARDIDALPTPRERECMLRFINSGMALHTIHDNRMHCGIMGGLSGYFAPRFIEVTGLTSLEAFYKRTAYSAQRWARHGSDQEALNNFVVPLMSRAGLIYEHRWSGWREGLPGLLDERQPAYSGGVSEPVPDVVTVPGRDAQWVRDAERLVNHMGQADYDWKRALSFYGQPQP